MTVLGRLEFWLFSLMSVVVKNGNVFLLNCVWKSFFLYKKVWIFLKKMSLLQLHHVWDRCITERPALGRDRSWTWETAKSQCLWHNSSSWSSPEAPVRIIFAHWAAWQPCLGARWSQSSEGPGALFTTPQMCSRFSWYRRTTRYPWQTFRWLRGEIQ